MLSKHVDCDFSHISVMWAEIHPADIALTPSKPGTLDGPSAFWRVALLGTLMGSTAQHGCGAQAGSRCGLCHLGPGCLGEPPAPSAWLFLTFSESKLVAQ